MSLRMYFLSHGRDFLAWLLDSCSQISAAASHLDGMWYVVLAVRRLQYIRFLGVVAQNDKVWGSPVGYGVLNDDR